MISKAKIKLINSLAQKKYRKKNALFVAESPKLVRDIAKGSFNISEIFATENYLADFDNISPVINEISESELKKISFLENPQGVLAILKIPEEKKSLIFNENELILTLDTIQDPGNMGTLIRLAHWFGIKKIVCSTDSVDVYNPKVVQASMAALAYLDVFYTDLPVFFKNLPEKTPIYGALMNGKNIYTANLSQNGIILLGNEGQGIKNELLTYINQAISIPDFPQNSAKVDSLNVSMAGSIILSEFRRRNFSK